jgi:plasmid maintenance system antidote protein VapI
MLSNMIKRKPASIGEILIQEFMKSLKLTQGEVAEVMGGTAQARQRAVQRSARDNSRYCTDAFARIRQQRRFLVSSDPARFST